ncbi:MAG: formylglycine-generating enzyme family protein [Myxococcales bacterium]|nr:formylglycine-generating enzyme family protein [Myxococcales bacterium]
MRGSPECEWGRGRDSEPETETTLTHDFWIQQTEVTQAKWTSLGVQNPSRVEGQVRDGTSSDCPVGNMTWFEALAFANKLSDAKGLPRCYVLDRCIGDLASGMVCEEAQQTGQSLYDCDGYRLPTEAEWEYAARAGTRSSTYAGDLSLSGDSSRCAEDPTLNTIAWYCWNTRVWLGGLDTYSTRPVATRAPNRWGLYDMAGNAGEWQNDAFHGDSYRTQPRTDPGATLERAALATALAAVTRGGFTSAYPVMQRSGYRDQAARHVRSPGLGFRLVRSAK